MPRSIVKYFLVLCFGVLFATLVLIFDRLFVAFNGLHSFDLTEESETYYASKNSEKNFTLIGTRDLVDQALPDTSVGSDWLETKQRRETSELFLKTNEVAPANIETQRKLPEEQAEDMFKHDWCRMQRARLDWKNVLYPCWNSTVWEAPGRFGINQMSDPQKSFISKWDIKPSGEFSRFVIQSVSVNNELKTFGGDSWRIHLRGPSSLAPTVIDLNNGSYEVLFLILEDGEYEAKISLDYSLCHGFKDPPPHWFKKGNPQGKNQPDGILKGDRPFLIAPFRGKEKVTFTVPPSKNNQSHVESLVKRVSAKDSNSRQYTCDPSCGTFLWDGFGRWVNGRWRPYIKDIIQKDRRNKEGMFLSFGDSVSNSFMSSLTSGPYSELCKVAFAGCQNVYHWVYDMRGYWGDEVTSPKEPLPDGRDYDHERVVNDVKKTLYDPALTEKSVLLMNMGIHFVAAVNFTNYRRLIDDLIRLVTKGKGQPRPYNESRANIFKGRLIWKTSTALNRDRFPNPHKDVRRFLTFPRVLLYNAYATSAMCRAGIDVIDVYPISDSYPAGTISLTDPVHYGGHVFRDVEALLYKMFSPKNTEGWGWEEGKLAMIV